MTDLFSPDLRPEISALKAELRQVRRAPIPLDQLQVQLDAMLDRLEHPYLKTMKIAVRHLASSQGADDVLLRAIPSDEVGRGRFLLGALVHFHRADMTKEFMKSVLDTQVPEPRMTPDARVTKADELARRLYVLELADEARVEQGLADRRPDVDACAVLGIPMEVAFEPRLRRLVEDV